MPVGPVCHPHVPMHGFRVAALYRPDTGAVVQLNNLVADGCSYEAKPLEGSRAETAQGNAYDGGQTRELRLRSLGTAERETLQAWYDAGVPVRCVALAAVPGGFNVQWYESVRMQSFKAITIGGKAEGRADAFDVVLYTDNPRAAVYRQANLVAHLGWADANADGVADGYTFTGGTAGAATFTGGQQQIYQSSGDRALTVDLELPISGIVLTASVLAAFVHNGGATTTGSVDARSFAGTSLGATTAALVQNVRTSAVLASTPAGTYTVRLTALRVQGGSSAATSSAQQVALRADSSAAYLPY